MKITLFTLLLFFSCINDVYSQKDSSLWSLEVMISPTFYKIETGAEIGHHIDSETGWSFGAAGQRWVGNRSQLGIGLFANTLNYDTEWGFIFQDQGDPHIPSVTIV